MANYDTRAKCVAQNIRSVRLACGKTQEAAANAANISLSHWNKLERGETSPKIETLLRIADALETLPEKLLQIPVLLSEQLALQNWYQRCYESLSPLKRGQFRQMIELDMEICRSEDLSSVSDIRYRYQLESCFSQDTGYYDSYCIQAVYFLEGRDRVAATVGDFSFHRMEAESAANLLNDLHCSLENMGEILSDILNERFCPQGYIPFSLYYGLPQSYSENNKNR